MIKISQIDDELSIYKNNTVVLLGLGTGFKPMLDLLRYFRVEIKCICDNNKDNWGQIRNGLNVISPPELKKMIEQGNSNVVIQVGIKNLDETTINSLLSIGVKSVISYDEAHKVLHLISFIKLYKFEPNHPLLSYSEAGINRNQPTNQYNDELPIFITQPPKTGDVTVKNTLRKNNINNMMTMHSTNFYNKSIFENKQVKITTAVRDPIARTISALYQDIWQPSILKFWYDLIKNEDNFFKNGGDAQKWLDLILTKKRIRQTEFTGSVDETKYSLSSFMETFKKDILDLSKYPFDKEKGYSIIREGNVEVFVYQLEKMNDIVKEMSDWVGQTPFNEWDVGNEASSKWIANSYKQAQKEIKIPKEYFDKCYDDPWIKHFYADGWRSQIKD